MLFSPRKYLELPLEILNGPKDAAKYIKEGEEILYNNIV